MFFLFIVFVSNHLLIYGSALPLSDDETGWWDAITSHLPLWYAEEKGMPDDNEQEIENSVKLMELFPTLKEKLESSNEKEQEEAKEFIEKMNTQINERKRYANILWKGVRTIIDMGRVESNERRSNEKQVNIFWQFIQGIKDFLKWIFGMKTDDEQDEHKGDKKNKHGKSSPKDDKHTNEHHSAPSTDLKAGLKDDLDRFDGKTEEFVHGDKVHSSHTSSEDEHPLSFDPKAGTKEKLDIFDSSKPVEFIHDKESASSDATKKEKM